MKEKELRAWKVMVGVGVALFILLGVFILSVKVNYAFLGDPGEQSATHTVCTKTIMLP